MKIFNALTLLASALFLATACGGSNSAPPAWQGELSAGQVLYVDGALQSELTITITDDAGTPGEALSVSLDTDASDVAIEPALAQTDAQGKATFTARTHVGGTFTFKAKLLDQELDASKDVTFGLELTLTADDLVYTHPGGSLSLHASVADAAGPVSGATLLLGSSRSQDAIDPTSEDSDDQGKADFTITTEESGQADLSLQVQGLTLPDAPVLQANFMGPTLSGSWGFPQPGGLVSNPRIGAIWIDFETINSENPPYRELMSIPMDSVPSLGDEGTYELPIPMDAPADDLKHPGGDQSILMAAYALTIYDDNDDTGDFSEGDSILAMSDEQVLLTYGTGDGLSGLGLEPGWVFMEAPDEESQDPSFVDLSDLIDQNDLYIKSAPCPQATVSGTLTFSDEEPASGQVRVAFMMVDAHEAFSDNWDNLWDNGNFYELASEAVEYNAGGQSDWSLDMPNPSEIFAEYQDFLVSPFESMPAIGLALPIVYLDEDPGNGVFTNDDNDLQTGDRIIGTWDLPFGYGPALAEWIDGPLEYRFPLMVPGLNQGYNLVQTAWKSHVVAVVNDTTLQLDDSLEAGHDNLCFKIERKQGAITAAVISGDDLSTGQTDSNVVTSASGGFAVSVQVGDELSLCNEIDKDKVLDFDTAYDLKIFH